jgi:hypothetical protein
MMQHLRQFSDSKGGKVVVTIFFLAVVCAGVYAISDYFKEAAPADAYYTTYICTETGKSFRHKNQIGEMQPILSPYSGKNTGVPAEACYWTTDGKEKREPTWVLLNEAVGKPGPTFCPDCGRLVVGHNPRPGEGVKLPPTETEYRARRASRAAAATATRE